jgi:hypothetical protein
MVVQAMPVHTLDQEAGSKFTLPVCDAWSVLNLYILATRETTLALRWQLRFLKYISTLELQ